MINRFIGVERFYLHANQLRSIIRYRRVFASAGTHEFFTSFYFLFLFIAGIRFFQLIAFCWPSRGGRRWHWNLRARLLRTEGCFFADAPCAATGILGAIIFREAPCISRSRQYIYFVYLETYSGGGGGCRRHPSLPRVQLYIRKYIFWACSRQRSA